jgi:hypothetical protein
MIDCNFQIQYSCRKTVLTVSFPDRNMNFELVPAYKHCNTYQIHNKFNIFVTFST